MKSLTDTFKAQVLLYEGDYMVTNAGGTASMKDGPTLLKMVTMLTYIDIRATTAHIPESLIHMKMQLMTQQGNITEFNDWVMEHAGQLAARGNIAPDLLTDSILYFFYLYSFSSRHSISIPKWPLHREQRVWF